jgi:hypothetical protein
MNAPFASMTCAEFAAILPEYLEESGLDARTRSAADAHVLDCADCAALVADIRNLVRDAGALPTLSPSRDLWNGIEARIEAPVVPLLSRNSGEHTVAQPAPLPVVKVASYGWRRLAVAASLLIATTAGVTYTLARHATPLTASTGTMGSSVGGTTSTLVVSRPSSEETYDHEIAALRTIVEQRRGDLDSATVATLQKDLALIDKAINEAKGALATDPASDFLMDRLNHAYDSKLRLLRSAATVPAGT